MQKLTDEKKPAGGGLLGRWAQWRLRRSVNRHRLRSERERRELGEWGYIPPGAVLVPRGAYRGTTICMLIVILSNLIILAGQWKLGAWRGLFG